MKTIHLLLFTICLGLLTSCSNNNDLFGLEDSSSNSSNQTACDNSNGFVTASVSSKEIGEHCYFAARISPTSEIQSLFFGSTDPSLYRNANSGQLIVLIGGLGDGHQSGCTSDIDIESSFSVSYYDNVNLLSGDVTQEEGFYSSLNQENLELCFDVFNENEAKGSFRAIVVNKNGDRKEIENGRFDFQF